MNVTKCDRCHKEMPKNYYGTIKTQEIRTGIDGVIASLLYPSKNGEITEYEICEECMKKIVDNIKNPDKQEV